MSAEATPFTVAAAAGLAGESEGEGPPIVLAHGLTATRRYLVDEGFLDREAGEYWRAGGTVL